MHNVRVLLAEDNMVNQRVAIKQLKKLGFPADSVANGIEVLDAVQRIPYDIIIMDRQMPEMDGFDTTAEIRARGLLRPTQRPGVAEPVRLPIVGLTASALKGDREICIAPGMDDYLAKPFTKQALTAAVERWTEVPR
jgi:CheY-like chemotaxis protein